MRYRLLIVEDGPEWHALYATLIAASGEFEIAGLACTAAEAAEAIDRQAFDGALIDIGLPDGCGIDLVARLARRQPRTDIAVCTVFEDAGSVLRAVRAGACGYIVKQNVAAELVGMLRHMKAGGAPISPRVARHILQQVGQPAPGTAPGDDDPALSSRELDVLQRVARGRTLKQAAADLGVAESTVRTHVKGIYQKLGVGNRGAAVFEATRRGLL